MRVHKPGTDCEVEFHILADGKKCPEFIRPEDDEEGSVAKVCFIPVADNATITIQGNFSGSALVGRVDVLADGSFVADRIIDDPSTKDPAVKYWSKRKIEVKTFLHVPDLNDKRNHLVRPKVVEGNLVPTRLSPKEAQMALHGGDQASSLGVGSITLVVSLAQQSDDMHGEKDSPYYPSVTLGSWRGIIDDAMNSGIRPEHELTMEVFPASNPIKDKKATQFWRDQAAKRYGSNVWAYLVFYYRTQEAIDESGAQPLTESRPLPPDDGTFVRAGEQIVAPRMITDSPSPTPERATGTRRSLRLGQTLSPSEVQTTRQTSLRRTSSSDDINDANEAHVPIDDPIPHKGEAKAITANPHVTQPSMQPPSNPTRAPTTSTSQVKTPRVSFTDPLEMLTNAGRSANTAGSTMVNPSNEHKVDDLASPFLADRPPRPLKSKPIPMPPPPAESPLKKSGATSSATQNPPAKRTIGAANLDSLLKQSEKPSPVSQTPPTKRPTSSAVADGSFSSSSQSSPTPPTKRPRVEELVQKKARLQAEVQAKRDRRVAEQKKLDEGKRQHEAQLRLWAEREARRLEEEEEEERRRRKAEEEEEERREEEALAAEMEALERENEAEDEEMARLEEERVLLEGMMGSCEEAEMGDA